MATDRPFDLVRQVRSNDVLGEGPCWHAADARLYWFDIKGRRLCWFTPGAGDHGEWALPVIASAAAPWGPGRLVTATDKGLGSIDTATGALEILAPLQLPQGVRTNDGKIDVRGRFWWSSMDDHHGERPGAIFRTDPDGTTHRVLDGIHIANTISGTSDGKQLYLADSRLGTMWTFDVDDAGVLGGRRELFNLKGEAGAPDGSALDAEGYLWNAQWGAWRIVRYAPDGAVDRIFPVPVQQPTSLAFGGPDLSTLYLTSARDGLSEEALAGQPDAGSLFAFNPGVRGLALPDFTGPTLLGPIPA